MAKSRHMEEGERSNM